MNAAALAMAAALAGGSPAPRVPGALVRPFDTIGAIPMSEVEAASRRAFLAFEAGGVPVELASAFGHKGEGLLRVRAPGAADAAYPWATLDAGLRHGSVLLRREGRALSVCSPGGCAGLESRSLLDRTYWAGAPLEVPHVRYTLTLSPDGARLSMLRLASDGTYWVASHTLTALRAGPVWFVAVDGTMYGLRLAGGTLNIVAKRIDER